MIVVAIEMGSRSIPHIARKPKTPIHTDIIDQVATQTVNRLYMKRRQTRAMHIRVQIEDEIVAGIRVSI